MTVCRVAVVGCGMIGRGIVEVCATAGIEVAAIETAPGRLAEPREKISRSLNRRVKRGKMTTEQCQEVLGRVRFSGDLGGVADAEVVIASGV